MAGRKTQSRRRGRAAALMLLGLLTACAGQAGPPGPRYADVAAGLPPPAADRARVFFYRDWEPYESLSRPGLYLNGQRVGLSIPGGVFYRDTAPGQYLVSVDTVGTYWNQFKTITLSAGDIRYIKVESLRGWESGFESYDADTFVVVAVDSADGRRDIAQLKYLDAP
jgi:hypothetical protein